MRILAAKDETPFVHPIALILLSIPAALLYMVIYNFLDGSSALDALLQRNSPMFGVNGLRDYGYTISLVPVFLLVSGVTYCGAQYLLQNKLLRVILVLILAALVTWASYYVIGALDFAFNL